MREIKRTDNGLLDGLLNQLELNETTPKNSFSVGPMLTGKNIAGFDVSQYPNVMSNEITLSTIFGKNKAERK